jgi:hypothetical protein
MPDSMKILNRGFILQNSDKIATTDRIEPAILATTFLPATTTTATQNMKADLAPVASLAIPVARAFTGIKAEEVRLVDPVMALRISYIVFPTAGFPRNKLTVPISPSFNVTDDQFFEDPADKTKKLYLPRYRISEQNVSGSQQYKISLVQEGNAWSLIINLDKYPAPTIEADSHNASELAHQVAILLRYQIKGSNGAQKELSFQEVTLEPSGLESVLKLNSLAERDEIYRALTEDDYQSVLIVRRAINVAIPVKMADASATIVSSGTHAIRGTWSFSFDTGNEGGQNDDVWWDQETSTTRKLVPTHKARIVNLGSVDFDSLSISQLKGMTYGTDSINGNAENKIPVDPVVKWRRGAQPLLESDDVGIKTMPMIGRRIMVDPIKVNFNSENNLINGDVFAVITNSGNYAKVLVTDYGYNLGVKWVTYAADAVTSEPLFREVTRALDDLPDPHPFIFPPGLHPYIFHNIAPSTTDVSGLVHLQVDSASYYQDTAQPYIFYYLPDSFKIARKPDSPHDPIISVKFPTEDSVNLSYFAMPYTDATRLSSAVEKLKQNPSFLAASLPQGIDRPLLQPLQVDPVKTEFFLGVPGQESSSGPFQDRSKNALINIITGITDQLTLTMEGFQEVFDSIFEGPALMLQGKVEANVYKDQTETIPFIARMNDLSGNILDYKEEQDNASGGVKATLINAIESPVKINNIGAQIKRDSATSRGEIRGLSLPVQLKPGESIQFIVAPLDQLAGTGPSHATFDPLSLEVLPDKAAILDKIVGSYVSPKPREITVKTLIFKDPKASEDLLEFIVEFKSGNQIELTPDKDTVKTTLKLSPDDLRNLILGNPGQSSYTYHITAVGKDGHLTQGPDKILEGDTLIVLGAN